jgi:hypothetical protein
MKMVLNIKNERNDSELEFNNLAFQKDGQESQTKKSK